MSYHPGSKTSGLRWREDTGIEKRCESCPKGMQWWPLTEEFYDFRKSFVTCHACAVRVKREHQRRVRRENDLRRLANLEYQRKYRAESKEARQIQNQLYYWADPDRQRAAAKLRYYRNRERILEQRRARYWAEKGAA